MVKKSMLRTALFKCVKSDILMFSRSKTTTADPRCSAPRKSGTLSSYNDTDDQRNKIDLRFPSCSLSRLNMSTTPVASKPSGLYLYRLYRRRRSFEMGVITTDANSFHVGFQVFKHVFVLYDDVLSTNNSMYRSPFLVKTPLGPLRNVACLTAK